MKTVDTNIFRLPTANAGPNAARGAEADAWGAVERYLAARRAGATERAYDAARRRFEGWAGARGLSCLPAVPETVAMFLAAVADEGKAVATVRRYKAAIAAAHAEAGYDDPTIADVVAKLLAGVRRTRGVAPARKAALRPEALRTVLRALPRGLLGVRDRAVLLLGFAAALRRSELAALTVADVAFVAGGVELRIRRSKTDQAQAGARVFVPVGRELCPVAALRDWLARSGVDGGPLFRRISRGGRVLAPGLAPQGITTVVQRAGEAAGLDPKTLGGHSLRSGFVTEAAARGTGSWDIMATTRHRSPESLKAYIRPAAADRPAAPALL